MEIFIIIIPFLVLCIYFDYLSTIKYAQEDRNSFEGQIRTGAIYITTDGGMGRDFEKTKLYHPELAERLYDDLLKSNKQRF